MPLPSDEEIQRNIEAWNLESDPTKRTPYTRIKDKKGDSVPVAARCDSLMVRRMDEILARALGWPTYKTRSDIIQDAIAFWLEQWDLDHPETASALSHQFHVEQMGRRRNARNQFFEMAKEELNGLRDEGDTTGLYQFIAALDQALTDFREDAPATFLSKMTELRAAAKKLVDASTEI